MLYFFLYLLVLGTLDRYKHLSPQFRSQTVELIAQILGGPALATSPQSRTFTDTATDTLSQSGAFQPSEGKPKIVSKKKST